MKTKMGWVVLGVAGLLLWGAHLSEAGPSLPVTKPPVQSAALLTGPMPDPAATNGQWFIDQTGFESARTNEFYDDALGIAGYNAITGYVDSITYAGGPGTPILAFTIQATIFNDTGLSGEWQSGSNRHGETLTYQGEPYGGPMVDTKLAAEFAIADTNTLPAVFTNAYRDRQPYIEAVNEDHWAWYCWNPADPDPEHKPSGNYFVPAWDFGTIPVGGSASNKLSFVVVGGLPPIDSRYAVIVQSFATSSDVLMNRTLSLKISTWIDEIALDTGAQQEEPPLRLSDVSVFHNLEATQDFGDAPDPTYPTLLASNGARHLVVPGVYMGSLIDAELDGQPDATATGDDKANLDDEDGVVFPGALVAGMTATVQVTASVSGYLNAWIDFNADGDWADAGENIFSVQAVAAGVNVLAFGVPSGAAITNTFARFRFTTLQAPISYVGALSDGEVEDYQVPIYAEEEELLDFGDADDPSYPTLLVTNGARHVIVPGVFLGASVDAEPDGQPDGTATGDDNNPPAGLDDEDGVTLPAVLYAGSTVQVAVVASVAGYLNAWIDWNADGDWADTSEQVFLNQMLNPGPNLLPVPVPVPPTLRAGGPQTRWRFTTGPVVLPGPFYVGAWTNGEVEDYEVQLEALDFGDAPDPFYPTLLASDGARHRVSSAYWLGSVAPDAEPEGLADPNALGDDNNNLDDEDWVAVAATLVRGSNKTVAAYASSNGFLNLWVDFNADGDWADGGEQAVADLALVPGSNAVAIATPAGAAVGPTFGRMRFCSYAGLGYTGFASDGEVEDYEITVYQPAPDTNQFWITNILHTATNQMTIWWDGTNGVTYEAQYTTNLLSSASPPWTAWGGYVTGSPYLQVDSNALAATSRSYRVVAPYSPPP